MSYSYRITKYTKINEDGNLCSLPDEWTSFFDVDKKVSLQEYEWVENQYIEFVVLACNYHHIDKLEIKNLESNGHDTYRNNQRVNVDDIGSVVKDVLRESVWCKLVCEKFEFHFGYDFYMYFVSSENPDEFLKRMNSPLTIQKYKSPYI